MMFWGDYSIICWTLVGAFQYSLADNALKPMAEFSPEETGVGDAKGMGYQAGLLLFGTLFCAGFAAFQKSLFPTPLMRLAGKIYFYPTLPFSIMRNFPQHWTSIDEVVIMGGAPVALLGHVEALYQLGVRRVVNLCDEYRGPTERYKELGIQMMWLPTIDHYEPNIRNMEAAVNFIAEAAAKGERVYVHCKAGHGRSAAIALAWMIYANPEESVDRLHQIMSAKRKVRRHLNKQPNVNEFYRRNMKRQKELKPGKVSKDEDSSPPSTVAIEQ